MQTYLQFWKKSFNWSAPAGPKELIIAMIGHVVVLVLLNILGILIPFQYENIVRDTITFFQMIMLVPLISLGVRLFRDN